MMKIAIIQYPGSHGVESVRKCFAALEVSSIYTVWHESEDLKKPDLVVIPGGASFGDYLRPGALAIASAITGALIKFARDGGKIIGIENGFQILCELKILPGVLLQNHGGLFYNEEVSVLVDNSQWAHTALPTPGTVLQLPLIGTHCRYYADRRTLKDLEESNRVVLRYCDSYGDADLENPFTGSSHGIAAITNRQKNVLGIMPLIDRSPIGQKILETLK